MLGCLVACSPRARSSTCVWPRCTSLAKATLSVGWQVGTWTAFHDVYFGEDKDIIASATSQDLGIYRGRLPMEATTFETGPLLYGATYFWRIDAVDSTHPQNVWQGQVWKFTTVFTR